MKQIKEFFIILVISTGAMFGLLLFCLSMVAFIQWGIDLQAMAIKLSTIGYAQLIRGLILLLIMAMFIVHSIRNG